MRAPGLQGFDFPSSFCRPRALTRHQQEFFNSSVRGWIGGSEIKITIKIRIEGDDGRESERSNWVTEFQVFTHYPADRVVAYGWASRMAADTAVRYLSTRPGYSALPQPSAEAEPRARSANTCDFCRTNGWQKNFARVRWSRLSTTPAAVSPAVSFSLPHFFSHHEPVFR